MSYRAEFPDHCDTVTGCHMGLMCMAHFRHSYETVLPLSFPFHFKCAPPTLCAATGIVSPLSWEKLGFQQGAGSRMWAASCFPVWLDWDQPKEEAKTQLLGFLYSWECSQLIHRAAMDMRERGMGCVHYLNFAWGLGPLRMLACFIRRVL